MCPRSNIIAKESEKEWSKTSQIMKLWNNKEMQWNSKEDKKKKGMHNKRIDLTSGSLQNDNNILISWNLGPQWKHHLKKKALNKRGKYFLMPTISLFHPLLFFILTRKTLVRPHNIFSTHFLFYHVFCLQSSRGKVIFYIFLCCNFLSSYLFAKTSKE